jgi:4-hydroxybenzoate polyprenyltransferase
MNPTPLHAPRPARARAGLRDYLELVKFSHTVFALPFALASMLVAANGLPSARVVVFIVLAMVGARSAAMGFNRIVDRDIDARNPRTAGREIPSGVIGVGAAAVLVAGSAALFFVAAWQLNPLALWLAAPTLALLFGYSYCKRFTAYSHLVLGLCLGIAPAGAWVAVRGTLGAAPVVLACAVTLWVAGFDVIYATMDEAFDREAGLHSLVQKLGIPRALNVARLFHLLFIVLLALYGLVAQLGFVYWLGAAAIVVALCYEHVLVRPNDLRRVNAAFFAMNGIISVWFLAMIAVQMALRHLAPH